MRILASLFVVGVLAVPFVSRATAEPAPLAVHMISGSKEYRSEESLRILKDRLKKNYRVRVTGSWVYDGATDLPGVD
ncbi:MAG: hypothetical protein AAF961_05390, partial [Planctomycetota bacterium]